MIITMQHCRTIKPRYCALGVRRFFMEHGLDFKDFLKNGIEEEKLAKTKQGMALRLIEYAHGQRK